MEDRRRFLKNMLLFSGGTLMEPYEDLLKSIEKAFQIHPENGSTYLDAEHVVILMQENRSFDHCFGSLSGVRGFEDPRAIKLPNGNPVWLQANSEEETFFPFRLDLMETKSTWMKDLPHTRSSQVDAFNSGEFNQWVESKKSKKELQFSNIPLTLGYYTREDLPFNYALADAFTICDQNFSSAMTSTWPNRLYLWSGTIRDPKNIYSKAYIRNDIPYGEAFWKTFPERLENNGVYWKIYQNDLTSGDGYEGEEKAWLSNFTCNTLEYLSQFNVRFNPRYINYLRNKKEQIINNLDKLNNRRNYITNKSSDEYSKLVSEIEINERKLSDVRDELEYWSKDRFENLSIYQKNLYERAFTVNSGDPFYLKLENISYNMDGNEHKMYVPKGDILFQFRKDVNEGKLPTVSWLVPPQNFSDHPSAPWYGAWFVSEILDILTKNPEVWKKTIFILTYDENDGYFDHIPPFVSPDPLDLETGEWSKNINKSDHEYIFLHEEKNFGVPIEEAREGPIGLGFRVPMIIASPWSRGGNVCSQVFDHTSCIQFLEIFLNKKFDLNIRERNISDWRRTICGDLTSVFSKFNNEKFSPLNLLNNNDYLKSIHRTQFKEEPLNFKILNEHEIQQIKLGGKTLNLKQEPGMRLSKAIPYELYVDGWLEEVEDQMKFKIKMTAGNSFFDKRSQGSPFIIYSYGRLLLKDKNSIMTENDFWVWNYSIKAGDTIVKEWPNSAFVKDNYNFVVYGPNGFFREFSGLTNSPKLKIQCFYKSNIKEGNLVSCGLLFKLESLDSNQTFDLSLIDNAYDNETIVFSLLPLEIKEIFISAKENYGWYDYSFVLKNDSSFVNKFAGRIETGLDSFTDPQIGRKID